MENEFSHVSVLLWECIEALNIRDGYTYVDCTTGGAGHSLEIAKRLGPNSRLICFDRDPEALLAAEKKLAPYSDKVTLVRENFSELGRVLSDLNVRNLGGVLMDLGCSSHQFDTPERGFSYQHDAPLDMRMDTDAPLTAYDVINTYPEKDLRRIIQEYGEERFAAKIAKRIVEARAFTPILSTVSLAEIIRDSIPAAARQNGPHPAKRTFQAIRIEVNGELGIIEPTIRTAASHLVSGGRIAIISFHSLEDRPVKQTYASLAEGCTCPPDFPVCVCGRKPVVKILTKKPILPTEIELERNPRSRSAKLRVAEKT